MKIINNKLKIFSLFATLLIFSCNNNSDETENLNAVSFDNISGEMKSSYKLLDYTPNVYHDYFKETDNSVGFSSLKPNSLSEYSFIQLNNMKENENLKSLKINNVTIDYLSKSNKEAKLNTSSIYGKKISFKINRTSVLGKNGETTETEVEMYVPDLVEITNPKVSSTEELYPVCYYDDFVLEWNADPENKEGLVVIAEYFGNNVNPENATNEHILNTSYIELDDGKAVLDNALFDDMPNLSFVHIILLRGNVAVEDIEGELYKFFAESHVRLPIIIAKDLKSVAKE